MNTLHRICGEALAFLIVLFGLSAQADAQALIWRNDWTVQAPPSFQYFFSSPYLAYQQQAPFVFSDDGELLMRTPTLVGQDDQIVRFTSSGTVRWRANVGSLGSSEEPTYSSMLANTDGSAFVAQYLLNLVKIGADGTIKWAATTDAYLLAPLTDQAVAVLGCNSLSALDAQTGQLLWKHVFSSQLGTCAASGLMSDAVGNTYVTLSTFAQANSPIAGLQLLKFDTTGHVLWHQDVAATSAMRPFGVSSSRVYVTPANFSSTDPVRAFAVSDGSLTWTAPGTHGLCLAGIPAEAIVSGASGVQRLADADGQPRWSQPSASAMFASADGNRILVDASAIDANTGAILWTAPLPTTDQYGNFLQYLTSGTLSDGSIIFAGGTYVQPPEPVLQRVDSISGKLLNQIAVLPTTQSFFANTILADALTIADAATIDTSTGPEIHVRALEATDGTLRWEIAEQLGIDADVPSATGIVRAGSAIAVSVAKRNALWVGVFDQSTGAKRWSTAIYTYLPSQDPGRITAYDPIADPDGNVVISYAATVGCPPPAFSGNCKQLSVVKLNATDGSISLAA